MYVYVCWYVCMYVCMYVYMYVCMYLWAIFTAEDCPEVFIFTTRLFARTFSFGA